MTTITLTVNNSPTALTVPPMKRLLDVLREDLHLTGTKEGCGEGECGACAILFNGELANSCLIPALQADNATITTIEGLAGNLCRCTGYMRIFESVKQAITLTPNP